MACSQIRFQVSALLDDSLEADQAQEIQNHLKSCYRCAQFYQEQLQLNHWMAKVQTLQLEPPAVIWQRIEARLRSDQKVFHWDAILQLFRIPQLRYVAAALVLLTACSLLLIEVNVSRAVEADGQVLAQLQAFTMEVPENPFFPEIKDENPFVSLDLRVAGNPFSHSRSGQ